MNRRDVVVTLGGTILIGIGFIAKAQGVKPARRIGSLGLGVVGTTEELQRVWAPARDLGWVEGRTILIERRWTTDPEKLRSNAEELVRLDVELIITNGDAATVAAKSATTRIPIVMAGSFDPVRSGLVANLARPGGNVTGYSSVAIALTEKSVEILREMLPDARRVGLLVYRPNPIAREQIERACRSLGLEPIVLEVASASAFEMALAEASRQRVAALLIRIGGGTTNAEDAALMRAVIKHPLPTVMNDRDLVRAGGLISLMADETEQYQILAYYVDRILHGASPSDLPVQQPTKFVLSINLKTAKTLRLSIFRSLLARADEVIE